MVIEQSILSLPMPEHDTNAKTVREYLFNLLRKVWNDKESFSGKRPYGNSGWEYDVYKALAAAGYAKGSLNDDGDLDEIDTDEADEIIAAAIDYLATEGAPKQ